MQRKSLSVSLAEPTGERAYPIEIGSGLLDDGELVRQRIGPAPDLLLVSNVTVGPIYVPKLRAALGGRQLVEAILPDGEVHKTLANVERIVDVLVTNRFGRDCTLIALGGGVVGDITGFAAAIYQRGVRFVQVPTTLLAQVDSSVGGKTGVNHPGGKNLVGAFHQPASVLADVGTLNTLPDRELRAGLAEVIKYGLICDADLFQWLEAHIDRLLDRDVASLIEIVHRCCEIKAQVVGRDEREQGERALLNLGHTFGHAIESATDYASWLHGEAVATGLVMAAAMSVECGWLTPRDALRVRRLVERTGLPVSASGIAPGRLRELMQLDKKVQGGRVRLVLLRAIGQAVVTADYPAAALDRVLTAHCSAAAA